MRRHLRTSAAAPAVLALAFGLAACGDSGDSTETMVDEEPADGSEAPADLEGDVDAGGEDGTDASDGEPAEDADADVEADTEPGS